jgi:cation transport regulator ChaC
MNKIKIFGYGSLINENSLKKTIKNYDLLFPAKLNGFIRVFNVYEYRKLTRKNIDKISVLNVEKSEFNDSINGICFEIDINDLDKLKNREKQYELFKVEICDFYNENNKYLAYVWRAKHFDAFDFQFNSKAQIEYLNICLEGCERFGKDFLNFFKKTTYIGNNTIYNLEKEGFL